MAELDQENNIETIQISGFTINANKLFLDNLTLSYGGELYVNNLGLSEWKPIDEVDENFLDKLIIDKIIVNISSFNIFDLF